jgi:hypothetical protein
MIELGEGKMAFPGVAPQTSTITVNVFDGSRHPISADADVLYTIRDGRQQQVVRQNVKSGSVSFKDLPFYNIDDCYTVIASAKGYEQAGFFPVKASPASPQTVDIMLLHKDGDFNFNAASWNKLPAKLGRLLAAGAASDDDASDRYTNLLESHEPVLACLLNITTAMSQIHLRQGAALDYFKLLNWDETMKQDRFFGYADAALVQQVRWAVDDKAFVPEPGFELFHAGATSSYKQIQFGEANVQITFHENQRKQIDGVDCVLVEPDIDYYKDLAAHALLEVLPNGFSGQLTDPRAVYVLRWIAGRRAGVPEFDPLYTIA